MKKFLNIYRDSRLIKAVVNRILLVQMVCMVIILALCALFLRPLLKQQSMNNANDVNAYMSTVFDMSMESITWFSQQVISSQELHQAIRQYETARTDEAYHNVRLSLNQLLTSQTSVQDVVIECEDKTRFNSLIPLSDQVTEVLDSDWYQVLSASSYGSGFTIQQEPQQESAAILYTQNSYIYSQKYTVTLLYNATPILESMEQYSKSTFSGFALIDLDHNVLYQNGAIDLAPVTHANIRQTVLDTKEGLYFSSFIPSCMWRIVSFAEHASISLMYRSYFYTTIILFVLLSILTFLFITPIIYRRINPIHVLANAIEQVIGHNLSPIPEIDSDDEIGQLGGMFNEMIDSLNDYIDKVIQHEQKEQQMKYSLLISQIDPHFIYNTMSIINSLARDGRTDDIIEINSALITILQDRLRVNSIQFLDTIRREVEIVKNYLLIQNHRYENKANVTWRIDDGLLDLQIPKNIIQPLVENALFHGLIDEMTGEIAGKIEIDIASRDGDLIILVCDNGRGIDQEQIERLSNHQIENERERGRHLGLKNIKERLAYLFGQDCSMQITNNNGTSVTIAIDLQVLEEISLRSNQERRATNRQT